MNAPRASLRTGDLQIDRATGEVTAGSGARLRLSPIQAAVLACLVERQGEVVSRASLFDRVWPNQVVSDDVLTRAISDLRQQLKRAFGSATFIETLPKRGYRWTDAAQETAAPDAVNQEQEDRAEPVAQPARSPVSLPVRLGVYLVATLLLASAFVWMIEAMSGPARFRVAVLPPDTAGLGAELGHELDAMVSAELMRLDQLEFLSHSAIAARPAQPFPYLQAHLGADMAVETRLRSAESGRLLLTISVVDARTGIVGGSRSLEIEGDRAGLAGGVRRLVSEIRPFLRSPTVP